MAPSYSLITGSSSGIGRALAVELAKTGKNLILVARRESILKELASSIEKEQKVKVIVLAADLSIEGAPQRVHDFCSENNLKVDILVNNAGYLVGSEFHETSQKNEEQWLQLMCNSMVHLTKLFLADMINSADGKIVITSSIAAYSPPYTKWSPIYAPMKSFQTLFGEMLNMTYRKQGIKTTVLIPGYTISELHKTGGVQDMVDRVPKYMKMGASDVAKGSVRAIMKGKKTYIPGVTNKIIVRLFKTLPNSWIVFLSSKLSAGRYDGVNK